MDTLLVAPCLVRLTCFCTKSGVHVKRVRSLGANYVIKSCWSSSTGYTEALFEKDFQMYIGGECVKQEVKIPQATTKRLPLYYRFLKNFATEGKKRISSQELSDAMKIDSATIRRDFSYFGALGKKGYGYDVQYLLEFFRQTLDQDEAMNVALIGVGNLGNGLLKYNFQKNHNTRIVVAFDTKAPMEGTTISDIPVFHPDRLEEMYEEFGAELAILTVSSRSAQMMTDRLVKINAKGILNFTPVRLSVPDTIKVMNIDLSVELQALTYLVRNSGK